MSDDIRVDNPQPKVEIPSQWGGSFDAYHASGLRVKLPVLMGYDYRAAFAAVSAALEAGWSITAPGLEAGEEKGDCGWVVRTQKEGHSGTAEVVDLYLVDDKFAKVRHYLNNADDVADFEFASGLKINTMPIYDGDNKIERGKNPRSDAKVVQPPAPFGFVWKANPKWDATAKAAAVAKAEVYKVPSRIFVRFEKQRPGKEAGEVPTEKPSHDSIQHVVNGVLEDLANDPSCDEINAMLATMAKLPPDTKTAVWKVIQGHCGQAGLVWDRAAKKFVAPKQQPQGANQ